jgi:hypothetical protein
MKIVLTDTEPPMNPHSDELAGVILERVGLLPRKRGSTDFMFRLLIELYERTKQAQREKKPHLAVMTVEEMGMYAKITRQTMYEYLRRWLDLNILTKMSYIENGKVTIGYKLNGNTLESAFEKGMNTIKNNIDLTLRYVGEFQKILKNEKIAQTARKNLETMKSNSTLSDY